MKKQELTRAGKSARTETCAEEITKIANAYDVPLTSVTLNQKTFSGSNAEQVKNLQAVRDQKAISRRTWRSIREQAKELPSDYALEKEKKSQNATIKAAISIVSVDKGKRCCTLYC